MAWSECYAFVINARPAIAIKGMTRINAATVKALSLPDVKEQYAVQGVEPRSFAGPEEFVRFIANEQRKMRGRAELAGLKPEES